MANNAMFIRGSFYDHAQDYVNSNRKAWIDQYICNPGAGPIKEKTSMKPGPYKSSSHGNIPLSLRGRELLMELRNQTSGKIAEAARTGLQPWKEGDKLSHARGELAQYMSDLEYTLERHGIGMIHSRAKARDDRWDGARYNKLFQDRLYKVMNTLPKFLTLDTETHAPDLHWARYPFYTIGLDLAAPDTKETKVNDKTNGAGAPPAEKTRSDLLTEATVELCAAQRSLESMQNVPEGAPAELTICTYTHGNVAGAISDLVKEQWAALAKKAVARAKARVAKAEKAVGALLT